MSKIGVLDSGLGGMVMLESLRKRYPEQDFVFLADQIHSPYGQRTEQQLIQIVNRNIEWLKKQGAKSILLACNTISCLDENRIDHSLPVQRVIEPTCRQLDPNWKTVLVCATPFTTMMQSYVSMISSLFPQMCVESVGLPYLCRDIEELVEDEIVKDKLNRDLKPYLHQVDGVILGCTHYPLKSHLFQKILNIPIIDSNGIELLNSSKGTGSIQYYTTDDPKYFDAQCYQLFHLEIHSQKAII